MALKKAFDGEVFYWYDDGKDRDETMPVNTTTPPDFTEQAMLDWLQDKAEEGHVSMCFEVDGGIHVTLEALGGERRAVRNADTIRDAIIRLMKEDFS